jgi:pimeloyl-ACP methyl ester carboxylesterase
MDLILGRVRANAGEPSSGKFAWPLVLLPELFTTSHHLALLEGYLVSIGWEVFSLDLYAVVAPKDGVGALISLALEAIEGISNDVIVMGHGLGGMLALRLAEHRQVRAGIALAPAIPGLRSRLISGTLRGLSAKMGWPLKPPSGRLLFEFVADADPFHREALIKMLKPGYAGAMEDVASDRISVGGNAAPRLIITGDSDIFAPYQQTATFAATIGAPLVSLQGRGHWIVGGRALEQVVSEVQRFLVKTLGEELLLLYPQG